MDSKYFATSRNDAVGPSPVKFSFKRKYDAMANSPILEKKPHVAQIKQTIAPILLTSKRTSIEQQQKSLPVFNCRQRILKELEANDTVLIMSETGSGKTTQIPQFLLLAGYAKNGMTLKQLVMKFGSFKLMYIYTLSGKFDLLWISYVRTLKRKK